MRLVPLWVIFEREELWLCWLGTFRSVPALGTGGMGQPGTRCHSTGARVVPYSTPVQAGGFLECLPSGFVLFLLWHWQDSSCHSRPPPQR